MKDRVKRIWEEHKSRKKKPQDVIEDDTAQAVECNQVLTPLRQKL